MLVDRGPVVWMVIHIADREVFEIPAAADDMEAIEVFDIAWIAMGDAVLMQSIWQGSFLDWAAFLLAVLTNHENRIYD